MPRPRRVAAALSTVAMLAGILALASVCDTATADSAADAVDPTDQASTASSLGTATAESSPPQQSSAGTTAVAHEPAEQASAGSSSAQSSSAAPVRSLAEASGPGAASKIELTGNEFTHEADCFGYQAWLSDELSGCLWHLDRRRSFDGQLGGRPVGSDINIGNVWSITKGGNVNVAVVDDTWNPDHHDLVDNVDLARSHNYASWLNPPTESRAAHATKAAGVIAARDNDLGSRGIAPRATLFNYNLVENSGWTNQADAMQRNASIVAVSNNSYGLGATTPRFTLTEDEWWEAVDYGLEHGFGGLGTSYVFAAGNERATIPGRDVNTIGYHAHRGVISACAVDNDGQETEYSNTGVALWVCAPVNGHAEQNHTTVGNRVLTTFGDNQYGGFGLTSAAAAEVSGVVALMRSVNPYLTWRDVKLILAQTAQKNDPTHASWSNGALQYRSSSLRYSFSPVYGFGVVDASAAVNAALNWKRVPAAVSRTVKSAGPEYGSDRSGNGPDSWDARILSNGETTELTLAGPSDIDFLEDVGISLYLYSPQGRDLRIELVSPSGTTSTLVDAIASRDQCSNGRYTGFDYTGNLCWINGHVVNLTSSEFLGEDPDGTWRLKVTDPLTATGDSYGTTTLYSWQARFLGHAGASTDIAPRARLRVNNVNGIETAVNEGSTVRVTASLSGGTLSQDVVIPVEIEPGTATAPGNANADYSGTGQLSIRIPAGQSSGSATFNIAADNLSEHDETLSVRWPNPHGSSAPQSVLLLGDPVEVTIRGNLAPAAPPRTVTLAATSPTVVEGEVAEITVTLSGGAWNKDIVLPVSYGPGTATATGAGSAVDFYPLSLGDSAVTSIRIPAGTTSLTYELETFEDDNWVGQEPPETVAIVVARPAGLRNEVSLVGSPVRLTIVETGTAPPPKAVDGCVTALAGDGSITGQWTDSCDSVGREGRYARFFTFTLASQATVTVDLESSADTYLFLRSGSGRDGEELYRDDDGGDSYNSRIAESLAAGDYTVEATTFDRSTTGAFTLSVDGLTAQPPPALLPEISIAAGGGVSEGTAASFTVTATPPPAADLDVTVAVSQSGDFGVSAGSRTVTIPASGSQSFTVATTNDSTDEADGSVTATLSAGTGYKVSSSAGSASVAVSDDDDPPPPPPPPPPNCVSDETLESARDYYELNHDRAPGYGRNWRRVLVAFGDVVDDQLTAFTAAEALEGEQRWFGWRPFREALECIEAAQPSAVPEISIAAGSGVTEGSTASFTITASPAPTTALTVDVTVSQTGEFGATTGEQTVTIPTAGTFTLTVDTAGDTVDEADGSVTAIVSAGTGYTVSSSAGSATVAVSDDDDPPPDPEISIAAGSNVTEGTAASFTLTASPAPESALTVSVTVAQSGDFGVATGARTVTIPAGGSYTLAVTTTGDSVDETDGSVTVSVSSGTGYTVSSSNSSATVAVSDDDDPPPPPPPPADCVSDETLESARDYYELHRGRAPGYGHNWRRVLVAFGDVVDDQVTAFTAAEALEGEQRWFGWRPFREALECIEAAQQSAGPEISITAGNGVIEGGDATFTVTASPAPASALSVSVTVTQSGDFGVSTGARPVTIPTTGSYTLTVDTADDSTDEADGSVTVTIDTGTGYTVSSGNSSATVAVADDDVPQISIAAGSDVTEGTAATFTLTASPVPAASLDVRVTVSQRGDFASTGARTVTIPTTGSATFTVATTNDTTHEADGSVTATIDTGTGYTVSSLAGAATVAVADDDDPAPPPSGPPTVTVSDATAVEGAQSLAFVVTLSKANPVPITFRYGGFGQSATLWQDWSIDFRRTFTLDAGETEVEIVVPIIDDDTPENDETLRIYVYATSGIVIRDGFIYATGTITDDD